MTSDDTSWWEVEPEDALAVAAVVADGVRLARLDRLARCVLSAAPVDLSCAECRVRMPALAERLPAMSDDDHAPPATEISGGASTTGPDRRSSSPSPSPSPSPSLAAAAAHVLRCAYCAQELVAGMEAMAAAARGALPEVGQTTLDLGFLGGERVAWTVLPESLRRLAGEVRIALGETAARFLEAPGLPPARPATSAALRGDSGMADEADEADEAVHPPGQVLVLPDDGADLTIRLAVGPAAGGRAAVALTLARLHDGDPLPDTRVVLYDGRERLLASATTESDGSMLFRDLVVGRYVVEVRRDGERWRLPLVVAAAG